jgi:hypothetical protein
VGEVSDVVTTAANAFLIEVVDRVPADSTAWRGQLDEQRARVIQSLEQQRLDEWITALRESASIIDRRSEVLQDPGDEEVPLQMPMGF